jgi:hypothetical protein
MSTSPSPFPGPLTLLTSGATWRELLYVATTFPLGLAYFLLLTVGWLLGLGTAILWVGLFVLFAVVALASLLVRFERWRTRLLLGRDLGPWRQAVPEQEALTATLSAHLGHRATWKGMLFLWATFPLGLASFALLVPLAALSLSLLAVPFLAWGAGYAEVDGLIVLPTPVGLLVAWLLGVVSTFATLYLTRGLAAVFRALATTLLSGRELTPAAPSLPPGTTATPSFAPPLDVAA